MKTKVVNIFGKFWSLLMLAIIIAVLTLMVAPIKGPVVRADDGGGGEAGCVLPGKQTNVGGVLTCDCTIQTENTCGCIVRCPPLAD